MDEPVIFPHNAGQAPLDFGPFFQALPTPYLIMPAALIVLAANAAYVRIVGRVASDILGLHVFDAFPGDPQDPLADGVAKLRASLQRVLAGACVDRMEIQRYDVAIEAGGSVFLPRYWKPVNMPVLHADGTLLYIIHSAEEVSGADVSLKGSLRDVLAALANALRDLKAVDDIADAAAAILGEALGAGRVGYATVDHAAATLDGVREWCAPGAAAPGAAVAPGRPAQG
ncbi:PAS domain-containing protein [Massilia sp. CCM 8733]|uniref:PAS domain-containing protein n=1 Tax=Massilia mucilaginosa TaxID=2609282 RepID=A0ABX0NRH1_9BURK|nr:PAS domain-containing protein [Massilia mucilaginosa]NHZ89481.1 PAS domain-containing protein [Massilia mucilaginosa]